MRLAGRPTEFSPNLLGLSPNGRRNYCLPEGAANSVAMGRPQGAALFSEAYCLSAQTSSASTRNAPQ